jgi:hypothetical protein
MEISIFGLKTLSPRDTDFQVAYPMHSACYGLLEQEFLEITAGPALDPTALGIYLKSQKIDPSGRRLKPDWSDVGYCGAEHFWENTLAWMEHLDNESQLN